MIFVPTCPLCMHLYICFKLESEDQLEISTMIMYEDQDSVDEITEENREDVSKPLVSLVTRRK